MSFFDPKNRYRTPRHERLYAAYEVAFTVVDFAAAFLFLVGSVLFFYDSTEYAGIWMFVIGSVCFALKPTIRLAREVHYWRMGLVETLAERARE